MNYKLPYDHILSYLYPVRLKVKRMLGCYALVDGDRILLLLRDREENPEYNGIYLATTPKNFEVMQEEVHRSNMEFDIDGVDHSWIFISEDLEAFDDKVKKACDLIKAGDKRIGKPLRIP